MNEAIIVTQLTQLQSEVTDILAQLSSISSGCAVRHRLNLTVQLTKLETQLTSLSNELAVLRQNLTGVADSVDTNTYKLTQFAGQINILKVKITDIENNLQKSKDNKSNFILQIVIVVLSSLITAALGVFCSYAWQGVKHQQFQQSQSNYYLEKQIQPGNKN